MKNSRTNNIRLGCEITLSVISIVLAILFITFVAQIYYAGGETPYTRAIVWGKLKYLIAPIVIWGVTAIGCFVLSVLFPREPKRAAPPSAAERVNRLRKRIPGRRDAADGKYINPEHKQYATIELWRYVAYGVASAFAVGVAVYAIVYLSRESNFSSKFNDDIIRLVKNVVPFIVASFVLFIGVVIYEYVVAKPQLNRMTKLLVECKGMPISRSPLAARLDSIKALFVKNEDKIVLGARIAVAVLAVVFIGIGIWDGGAGDVLDKATALCKECIGLG